MDLLVVLISATVLLAVFLLVVAIGGRRGGDPLVERLEAYRSDRVLSAVQEETLRLRKRSYSGLPVFSAFLSQFKGSEVVALQLDRAGLPLRVGEYYLMRYGLAVLFFLVPFAFSQSAFTVTLALGLATMGYMLPALYVGSKKRTRMTRLAAQLVEMLGLVSNALKSGYGLVQSFEFAARQVGPPLSLELRRMLRDTNLGMSAEDALNALGERIGSADLDMVLTAINIQRTAGGNLAEILENVAHTMRERERLRGEVNTLTAQQKMTGVIIGGLPVGMGLLFMVINPAYMGLLFTEMAGRIMLLLAIGLEVAGALSMRRILSIEV